MEQHGDTQHMTTKEFRVKIDCRLYAEGIDDALVRLGRLFAVGATGEDSDVQLGCPTIIDIHPVETPST